jgi:3-phenylpropionate/trans-cinnamate dioxygenase ferredoxin reductase subunit
LLSEPSQSAPDGTSSSAPDIAPGSVRNITPNVTPNILIIGAGPAGTFAAIAAKQQNPGASVTLLTEEHCEPYEKPPLSKAVLLGKVLPSDAQIAGPGGIIAHGVILETKSRCASIDRAGRAVVLDDGRRLPYDALVITTGAVAREIAQLPIGMPGVHYLRTERHAHVLKAALRKSQDLLVIGGGLIGLEVAASAAELGVKTTVLEVAPRILARVCDEETSALVHAAHVQHGVQIRLSTAFATAVVRADGRVAVELANGADREILTASEIVVGVGSKPDDGIASVAGLQTDGGIVVDEYCRTSDPAIFAAGDVVRFPGPQGLIRLENWRHAQDQGVIAGRNAAGGNEVYAAIPSFWSEQYDLYIQGIGWPAVEAARVRRPMPGNKALVFEVCDGRVTYAMGINVQRDLSIARRLIERRVVINCEALADPAQPLAKMLTS